MAACLWVWAASIAHPPFYCLPSKGLPLCCPPAKVHTSPTTPQRGLLLSPTSRAWAHSCPTPQTGEVTRGLWLWPPDLSQPGGTMGSQARLGHSPKKGRGPGGKGPERTLALHQG